MGLIRNAISSITNRFNRWRYGALNIPTKSVIELSSAPPANDCKDLSDAIDIYAGEPRWLKPLPSDASHAGYGYTVPQALSRLVLTRTEFLVKNNDEVNNMLQSQMMTNLKYKLEQGIALNMLAAKPYYPTAMYRLNADGNKEVFNYHPKLLETAFFTPDTFLIDKMDSSRNILQIRFFTQEKQGGNYYVLVEMFRYDKAEQKLRIDNTAFVKRDSGGHFMWEGIGVEAVPLSKVEAWSDRESYFEFTNVETMPIALFIPVFTDNVNFQNPFGRAGNLRATPALQRLDLLYYAKDNEINATQIKLIITESALMAIPENEKLRWENLSKILLRLHNDDANMVHTFAPDIRHDSYIKLIENELRHLETLWGLSHGEISETQGRARTATETTMLRDVTLSTKESLQCALGSFIEQYCYACQFWLNLAQPREKLIIEKKYGTPIRPVAELPHLLNLSMRGGVSLAFVNRTHFGMSEQDAIIAVDDAVKEKIRLAKLEVELQELKKEILKNEVLDGVGDSTYDYRLEGDELVDVDGG